MAHLLRPYYQVFNDYWVMVALIVNVLKRGVGFSVGLVCVLGKIECDIQKVNNLFVDFDCDFQSFVFEDAAKTLFDVFCNLWCGICYGKAVVSVESYVLSECLWNLGKKKATHFFPRFQRHSEAT